MKKISLFFFLNILFCIHVLAQNKIYYVDPSGNDSNSGSINSPWKSLFMAAKMVKKGSTVIFNDGVYIEKNLIRMSNSGTLNSPIVFKALNSHQAKIIFRTTDKSAEKILFESIRNVSLEGFDIEQEKAANLGDKLNTLDILIAIRYSNNITIKNNKLFNAFEEAIKANNAYNLEISNNYIENFSHEGIDFVNVSNSIISNNYIKDIGRIGIVVKGGCTNIKIINNTIFAENRRISSSGISIGGETNKKSTLSDSGYEAYKILSKGNKIFSEKKSLIRYGISFMGAENSVAEDNIVLNAENGFFFANSNGIKNGWKWNPVNKGVKLYQNTVSDSKFSAYKFLDKPTNFKSSYNKFFNNKVEPKEKSSNYLSRGLEIHIKNGVKNINIK